MVADDLSTLLAEIESMLREPPGGGDAELARVEQTLTDGYARALALEGERLRLERRISQIARQVVAEDAAGPARELIALSDRLAAADGLLRRLRGVLSSLRRHADAVRAAA